MIRTHKKHTHENLFYSLPNKKYPIIYADPPWDYKGQRQHNGKGGRDTGGADIHYPTITLDNLKDFPIHNITEDDCLLFMWTSSPHLDQAIDLGTSWGFKWATIGFVWNKQKTNPGFYTMSQCEMCMIFKKGKIPSPRGQRNIRQLVEVERSKHSKKPNEVRERIDVMFPEQEKLELFSREKLGKGRWSKWTSWGNEI